MALLWFLGVCGSNNASISRRIGLSNEKPIKSEITVVPVVPKVRIVPAEWQDRESVRKTEGEGLRAIQVLRLDFGLLLAKSVEKGCVEGRC